MNHFSYQSYPNVTMGHYGSMTGPMYWCMSNRVHCPHQFWPYPNTERNVDTILEDKGKKPFVVNINRAVKQNNTFRTAIWTGRHLQVTLMSINIGEDIGLEVHPTHDQFLRIEEGYGIVRMGKSKNNLNYVRRVWDDSAIMVPAGIWHNVTNIGNTPLKLYSIYAPPEHPYGTVHVTKADAIASEENI